MAARKKTTVNTAAAAATEAKPRQAAKRKPVSKNVIVRNLRGVPVHMRLGNQRDPYRVQLAPRGQQGDTDSIPKTLTDSVQFVQGEGFLFEIITGSEARQQQYEPVGYLPQQKAEIVRDADTTRTVAENWDGTGQSPRTRTQKRQFGAAPGLADVPGSDVALHAGIRAGSKEAGENKRPTADDMIPEGALEQRATVERVRGEQFGR